MSDPLTWQAIGRACDADHVTKSNWQQMTRRDTAVGLGTVPTLHKWTDRFDLWEAVQYQAFHRRHAKGVPA